MKRLLTLLFTITACLPTIVSQTVGDAQAKQQIATAARAIKTMQCDFVQTKNIRMLNERMVSRGTMCYQQASQLRWEYQSPYSYTFILNGDKVLLKNGSRNDVIDVNRNKMFKEIARIMMNSIVAANLMEDQGFKVQMNTTAREWTATLVPLRKEMKQMFQQIVLHFHPQKRIVTRVDLKEKNGDATVIELNNMRLNEKIRPDVFAIQ